MQTIPETAISVNNRQTILFSKQQTIDVRCDFRNGTIYGPKQFRIEGLTKITLPNGGDCTATTRKHEWRADPYLEIELAPRILDIELNITEILEVDVQELIDKAGEIEIDPFHPVSFSTVTSELGKINYLSFDDGNWKHWLICITAVLAVCTCTVFGCYMYRNKKYRQLRGNTGDAQFIAPKPTDYNMADRSSKMKTYWRGNRKYTRLMAPARHTGATDWRVEEFLEDTGSKAGKRGGQKRAKMLMIPCETEQVEKDATRMLVAYNEAREARVRLEDEGQAMD